MIGSTSRAPAALTLGFLITLAPGCSTDFPAPTEFEQGDGSPGETGSESTGEPAPSGCAASVEAMVECVERDRYVEDLVTIAQERAPGDEHWQAVQDLCFDRFTEQGYDVELQQYGTGVNVIGTKIGTTTPEELVVVAAHYDHLSGCSGADDNATGVSAVLEAARVLAQAELERTVVVACWDQEEIGLIGSRAWVLREIMEDTRVIANFNFEMIGYVDATPGAQTVPAGFDVLFPEAYAEVDGNGFAGDFITLVGDDLVAEPMLAMERHADALGLPAVVLQVPGDVKNSILLSDLRRSDHAPFWEMDLPGLMITDSSEFRYPNYHCPGDVDDSVDLLDHEFSTLVIKAAMGGMVETLGLGG